jgi:hypothetical protein
MKNSLFHATLTFSASLLALVSATGCASHPPPSDHLASAIAAARGADEAGARQVPRAALQLKLAEEQIATAKKMVENGDNLRADYMTLRAYNDAELALALARENAARQRADQLQLKSASVGNP